MAMVERLGQIIYWVGCAGAALLFLLGVFGLFRGDQWDGLGLMIFAGLLWLAGRAVLYVLAGR